jgi:hypothetical protein
VPYSVINKERDDSDISALQDKLAHADGKIYNLDAPGITDVPANGYVRHVMRVNFKSWAEWQGLRISKTAPR